LLQFLLIVCIFALTVLLLLSADLGERRKVLLLSSKKRRARQRRARTAARQRGEIPPSTEPVLPKLHHNTPEGKCEAFLRRPLFQACVLPPFAPLGDEEKRQRKRRLEYIQQGLDEGYPLLKKVDDSRIFKTPTAIGNFLPVALKHVSLAELKEVIRPKY
jgi:hypothetical protein